MYKSEELTYQIKLPFNGKKMYVNGVQMKCILSGQKKVPNPQGT